MGNNDSSAQSLLISKKIEYDAFVNHRGIDTKDTLASLIFHNLEKRGIKVFLDKYSIQVGDKIPETIEKAIASACVHVVILSANYAESEWCLTELCLILKTRAPIVPVFWGIEPSELLMEDKGGMYARAFKMHSDTGKIKPQILEEWKLALRELSDIKGLNFHG
ncbi:hypothetical protein SUGI_0081790 [Cryptomeria japonica]|nr:hypothetical protein SUGI_0081790 [Cryptomeria japonica]